jgi:hypothetical protein
VSGIGIGVRFRGQRIFLPSPLCGRQAARTKEALLDAIGVALGQIMPSDAHGYFTHGGFQLPQLTDH